VTKFLTIVASFAFGVILTVALLLPNLD
jgi:hypothetical protein